MWEYDESDIIEEIERGIDTLFEEAYSGSVNPLFDLKRNLVKPLFRIEVKENEITVSFDLPGVEKEDILLSASEDTLSIEAKMKKPISLMVGGTIQKRVEFERYAKKVRLPVRIDPEKAKAKVTKGLLTIQFPISHKGTIVRVD